MSLSKCWLAKCPEFPGTDYLGPEEWQVPSLVSILAIQATFVSESETKDTINQNAKLYRLILCLYTIEAARCTIIMILITVTYPGYYDHSRCIYTSLIL